jgi:carbonic anhydrase/acetyltransferase-like protein (isoleucine patch superfamily)
VTALKRWVVCGRAAPQGAFHFCRNVTVGHIALLHACEIHDNSFIGMKASVLDGVVVESGAMVAAGAVATPRKVVRRGERSDTEKAAAE